jgi:activator of 2-hydroxyglutaryl-CoA dehydratase
VSKRFAGIDIGSRTIELVVVGEDGDIIESLQADTGFDPMAEAKKMIEGVAFESHHSYRLRPQPV